MTGLWHRMNRVFSARAHARVDQAEDPEQMLNQLQRELIASVSRSNQQLAAASGWLANIDRQIRDTEARSERAATTAAAAVRNGDEQIARDAIARKREFAKQSEQLCAQRDHAQQVLNRQRRHLDRLKDELSRLREKRRNLIQRARFAHAAVQLGSDLVPLEPINEVVERMEEKVTFAEAASQCSVALDEGRDTDAVEDYAEQAAIDTELAELKNAMNEEK